MAAIHELLRYLKLSSYRGVSAQGTEPHDVYFSLTTLPQRIEKIRPTLRSLLDQTIVPKTIFLNVPRTDKEGVPFTIPQDIKQLDRIRINYLENDLGPATKFLPLLKDPSVSNDVLIIVLDDDQVYPKNLLESYLKAAKNHPNEVMTLCGWTVPRSMSHSDKKILRGAGLKIFNPNPNIAEDTRVEIIQGASSYAIRKRFFDDSIFDYSKAPKGAFFVDDIWISGHLAKKGISRYVIKPDCAYCRLQSPGHLGTPGLRDTTNADNSNNDSLYKYFKDYWKLFD